MRILVVEDELKMASLLRRGLVEEGHAVDLARTGDDALWMAQAAEYDAIVLDLMLPGVDGIEVCRRVREQGVWAPVLMLTARDAVEDRVAGLDAGADDYLPKPFSFAELLARLRALVRRGAAERPAVLEVGDLRLDPATRQAWRGEAEIHLSAKEFALLETFMRRPGQVLSRYQLLEHAWDYAYENRSNVVDVYVRYLRDKVDRPFGRDSLETVRGVGYRLRRGERREPRSRSAPAGARLRVRDGRRARPPVGAFLYVRGSASSLAGTARRQSRGAGAGRSRRSCAQSDGELGAGSARSRRDSRRCSAGTATILAASARLTAGRC